jgi:hypothetical protein
MGGGGAAWDDLWLAARKSAPVGVPNKGDLPGRLCSRHITSGSPL